MASYPINLNLKDRLCIVIGDGRVAWRKVNTLLDTGAKLRIVSPHVIEELTELIRLNKIEYYQKFYEKKDIMGAFLVICATDNKQVNALIGEDAQKNGALVNVVDDSYPSDFTVPAQIKQGDLLLTVSTSGKSPEISRQLRMELESTYGRKSYADFITLVASFREKLKHMDIPSRQRELFWRQMINREVLEFVRNGEISIVEARFKNAISSFRAES